MLCICKIPLRAPDPVAHKFKHLRRLKWGEGGTNIIVLASIQLHSTGLDSVSPLSQMQGFYSHEWEQVRLVPGLQRGYTEHSSVFQLSTEIGIRKNKTKTPQTTYVLLPKHGTEVCFRIKRGLGRALLIFCLFLQNKSSSGRRGGGEV